MYIADKEILRRELIEAIAINEADYEEALNEYDTLESAVSLYCSCKNDEDIRRKAEAWAAKCLEDASYIRVLFGIDMPKPQEISKESFLTEFNGHCSWYSSFLVLNTSIDEVIRVLNEIDPEMCVGSGSEDNGNVSFEICKICPEAIYHITRRLKTIGYADTAWDDYYFIAAKDGKDYDGFTAKWDDFYCHDEDEDEDETYWDAFFTVTDKTFGVEFHSGAGYVDDETKRYYESIVDSHKNTL